MAKAGDALLEMTKARADLLMDAPFFGSLALRLKFVQVDDPAVCDTAAVDGRNLYYHPPFIKKLTREKRKGLIAHEVMHCVFQHMQRRNGREMSDWNIACDYTINEHLLKCGFHLPEEGIFDTEKKYVDWGAETIYADIHADKPEDKPKQSPWGLIMDAAGGQDTALQVEWEIATRVAANIAKQAGKLPGSFAGMLEDFFEPVVDWRSVLWPFVTNLTNEDHSWSRPNRAYISEDIYLPSMRSETLGSIAFIIDTSGSMPDEAVKQCWSEVLDVAISEKPSNLIVLQVDAKVQSAEEIDMDNPGDIKVEVKGRGGTSFAPGFAYLKEHYQDLECIIYLTDMECGFSDIEEPECPVLWMSTSKTWNEPPFGEVIYMALDKE